MRVYPILYMCSIRHANVPTCTNCKFYRPQSYLDFHSELNRCGKFGYKDIYSGEIHNDYVSTCRTDETKCGIEGKEFEADSGESMTQKWFLHGIMRKSWLILLVTGVVINTRIIINSYCST
jgi:hypothetical protein